MQSLLCDPSCAQEPITCCRRVPHGPRAHYLLPASETRGSSPPLGFGGWGIQSLAASEGSLGAAVMTRWWWRARRQGRRPLGRWEMVVGRGWQRGRRGGVIVELIRGGWRSAEVAGAASWWCSGKEKGAARPLVVKARGEDRGEDDDDADELPCD